MKKLIILLMFCVFLVGCEQINTLFDKTPPEISDVSYIGSINDWTITWITNEPATSQVEYGITTDYGYITNEDNTYTSDHSVVINYPTDTPCHFRVISKDRAGNQSVSDDNSWGGSPPPP
jgi:hypothetical protein